MDPNDITASVDALTKVFDGKNDMSWLTPQLQKDFNVALNLIPYNLKPGAAALYPVLSPIVNQTPRVPGAGKATEFLAITGVNTTNVSIWAAEGVSGNQVTTTSVHVTAPYKSMSLFDAVTLEAEIYGRGQVGARAEATVGLLRAFKIAEESAMLFGQSSGAVTGDSVGGSGVSIGGSAGACANPTLGHSGTDANTTGTTYYVGLTMVTGTGESPVSGYVAVTTLATEHITVTPAARPAGQPILYYNAYVGTVNTGGASYMKITQATNGAAFNILTYTAGTNTPPTADTTGNSLAYNGIFPQISATNSGAYTTFTNSVLTLAQIQTAVKSMWDVARGDPGEFWVNSTESGKITDLTLGVSNTPYIIVVKDQNDATGGNRVSRLINKFTGREIVVKIHPYIPQGNILMLSRELPGWYAGTVKNVWSFEAALDYTQLNYAPSGPKWPFEIRVAGCLLLQLPAIQGWVGGITAG